MNEPTLPMDDINDRAVAGDNNPPEPVPYNQTVLKDLSDKTDAFIAVSNTWAKTEIASKGLAEQLNDQINGLVKLRTAVEAARVEQKAPHLSNGSKVDFVYNSLRDLIVASESKIKPKLAEYAARKSAEAEKQRLADIDEADRVADVARQKTFDAQNSDKIEDHVEAEKATKQAVKQQKQASKPVNAGVKSATGAGRTMSERKRMVCEIENVRHLFMRMQDNPKVHEVLLALANAEANSKDFPKDGTGKIPGVKITITKTLV